MVTDGLALFALLVVTIGEGAVYNHVVKVSSEHQCLEAHPIKGSRRSGGIVILTKTNSGILQCGKLCMSILACDWANFNKRNMFCDMRYSNGISENTTSDDDWDILTRTYLQTILPYPCASNPCLKSYNCITFSSRGPACIKITCPKPVNVTNGYVVSLRTDFLAGNKAYYECTEGSVWKGEIHGRRCMFDGRFEPFKCI